MSMPPKPVLLMASVRNMTSPRALPFVPNMKDWVRLEMPIPLVPPKSHCFPLVLYSSSDLFVSKDRHGRALSRLFFWCSFHFLRVQRCWLCLLYTSDAADDLLCVDLGGRR